MSAVILQSDWAKGIKIAPVADCAGEVVAQAFTYTIEANMESTTDIIELGVLPAGCAIVDAILHCDDIGSVTLDAGVMSGEVGSTSSSRTCGSELFSAAADSTVNRMSAIGGFQIAPSDVDRSIGVFPSADVTAADQVVTLILFYRA